MNNWEESYEGIYGKGIMLITILTLIFYYFAGNHNISWDGLAEIKIWLLSGVFLFYIWHFKLVYDDNKNKFEPGQVIKVIKATSRQKGKYGEIVRIKYNKRNTLYIVEFETGYKRTYTAWEIQAVDNTDHQTCRCR